MTTTDHALLREFCDQMVPGSADVGAEQYLLGLRDAMPAGPQEALTQALATATGWIAAETPLADVSATPEFGWLRALVLEAYYSGYCAPGSPGPDGWAVTGFGEAPMAKVANRDFSYLPIVAVRS